MPSEHVSGPLHERAAELTRRAVALATSAAPLRAALAPLLRTMNSYYSNLIEGEHTLPRDIDRALRGDFDAAPDRARLQRIALAHIEAELAAERDDVPEAPPAGWRAAFAVAMVLRLHRRLYERLTEDDRRTEAGDVVAPGELRSRDVLIGRHVPPPADRAGEFLERWSTVYRGQASGERSLIAIAAAHHRLAWIHPFRDGNGRTARLQTHLALHGAGLLGGLWSPLRGFARTRDRYRALLAAADAPRAGDVDGRGSLSERALVDWIDYVLAVCADQVDFMAGLLRIDALRERLAGYVTREKMHPATLRPLQLLFTTPGASMTPGDFKAATGASPRTSDRALADARDRGLVVQDPRAPRGLVAALPTAAVGDLFPGLFPEAAQ